MEFSVYLNFNGNCEAAMNFYTEALGAELQSMQRYSDSPQPCPDAQKDKILHSVLIKDGFVIMGSDGGEHHPITMGNSVSISINFHEEAEIDRIYANISEGGAVLMPLQDTFWGAKFGICTDKFGINWMFNYDRPKAD